MQGGAEIGYGAKAQEVLGQVRGRFVLYYYHMAIPFVCHICFAEF